MLESFTSNKFNYQRLSEAEQRNRHILGRLTGVIADTKHETRNGRLYGRELWEKVFDDPIMKEKIRNKCCFGELNHPTDREEIDATKVAICLAEVPKISDDGKLYGIFDILDTPNGRILKTLCDYGCNIGVSSRGSGDVMPNNEVDPDTYNCECFDAVIIPAVADARQKLVMESLETNKKTLRQALIESYDNAEEKDKAVMKEALDQLNINVDDVPLGSDPDKNEGAYIHRMRELENNSLDEETETDNVSDEDNEEEADTEEVEIDGTNDESEISTVEDLKKEFDYFDKDLNVKFAPIVIGDEEYPIDAINFNDSDDGYLTIEMVLAQETGENIEDAEVADENIPEDNLETTEEAEDNGSEEVLESLKEMIRQKDLLENELKSLKKTRAVSDAEAEGLKEELDKYKSAFARTSKIAAETKRVSAENKQLVEQLNQKDVEIKNLRAKNSAALTEGLKNSNKQVTVLSEQLKAKDYELSKAEEDAKTQASIYRKKINESLQLAEKYRKQCKTAVDKYISFRASMLGVKPAEIINKLDEQYSMDDIDKICESILVESVGINSLPRSLNKTSKIKIQESKENKPINLDNGYDIDDELLTLAGLK